MNTQKCKVCLIDQQKEGFSGTQNKRKKHDRTCKMCIITSECNSIDISKENESQKETYPQNDYTVLVDQDPKARDEFESDGQYKTDLVKYVLSFTSNINKDYLEKIHSNKDFLLKQALKNNRNSSYAKFVLGKTLLNEDQETAINYFKQSAKYNFQPSVESLMDIGTYKINEDNLSQQINLWKEVKSPHLAENISKYQEICMDKEASLYWLQNGIFSRINFLQIYQGYNQKFLMLMDAYNLVVQTLIIQVLTNYQNGNTKLFKYLFTDLVDIFDDDGNCTYKCDTFKLLKNKLEQCESSQSIIYEIKEGKENFAVNMILISNKIKAIFIKYCENQINLNCKNLLYSLLKDSNMQKEISEIKSLVDKRNLNCKQYDLNSYKKDVIDNQDSQFKEQMPDDLKDKQSLSNQCEICITQNNVDTIVLPCEHLIFCQKCISEQFNKGNKTCPKCRSNIEKIEKI